MGSSVIFAALMLSFGLLTASDNAGSVASVLMSHISVILELGHSI